MKKNFVQTILVLCVLAMLPSNIWALRYAKAVVSSDPSTGGYVSVSPNQGEPASYTDTNKEETQKDNWATSNVNFTFYRYAKAANGYTFKGWSESSTANAGEFGESITITSTSSNNVSWNPATKTYYAIFAHLSANNSTWEPTIYRGDPTSQTITINHAHANNVTLALSGEHAHLFSINTTSFVSTTAGSQDIVITYSPDCNGEHTATLTAHSDNGLADVTITLHGTAKLNEQTLTWDNEPVDHNVRVGSSFTLSASTTSGLALDYTSSNPAVLSVEGTTVTAVGVGEATITASQAGDCTYAEAAITTQVFTVNDKQTPTFWLNNDPAQESQDMKVDDATTITITNVDASLIVTYDEGLLSYSFANGVATITATNTSTAAGIATLTLTQPETEDIFAATRTFTFNISKYNLSAAINYASTTWNTTLAEPFSVQSNETTPAILTDYSVEAITPEIASYNAENGNIQTYAETGDAQFLLTRDADRKYNALSATLTLTVNAATANNVIYQDNTQRSFNYGNSYTYDLTNRGVLPGDVLSVNFWEYNGATGGLALYGYTADGTETMIMPNTEFSTTPTEYTFTLDKAYTSIKVQGDGGAFSVLYKYCSNFTITRDLYIKVDETVIDLTTEKGTNATTTFTLSYGSLGSTFQVLCDNPKVTVTPASFDVIGTGTQELTIIVDASENGTEYATITIYDNAYKATIEVTCTIKDAPTAIDNMETSSDTFVRKVVRNGQVYIIRGEEMYNLQGQKVQ